MAAEAELTRPGSRRLDGRPPRRRLGLDARAGLGLQGFGEPGEAGVEVAESRVLGGEPAGDEQPAVRLFRVRPDAVTVVIEDAEQALGRRVALARGAPEPRRRADRIAGAGLAAEVLARLGADVRRLVAGETYVALETGAVEGVAGSLPDVDRALGLPALAGHVYFPSWQRPATFLDLMVAVDRWEALPAADRARIEAVCGDNVRHGLAASEAAQFGALKSLFADGVEMHRWSPALTDAFRQAWRDVAGEAAGADPGFRRVWRSLRAFRADYAIWREISQP